MLSQRIKQGEETRLVCKNEKTHQPLRFIIKYLDPIGRWMSHCHKRRERNQIPRRDCLGARFCNVTASALVTGLRSLGNILRESFVQPTWDAIGIESVKDEMRDFVSENVAGEFVGRVALVEEVSLRLTSARPRFQVAERLKLLPILGPLENIDVRLCISGWLFALQLFRDSAIMKLSFD